MNRSDTKLGHKLLLCLEPMHRARHHPYPRSKKQDGQADMAVEMLLRTLPETHLPWVSLLLGVFFKQIGEISPLRRNKYLMPSFFFLLCNHHLFPSINIRWNFRQQLVTPAHCFKPPIPRLGCVFFYSLCLVNVEAGQSSMVDTW